MTKEERPEFLAEAAHRVLALMASANGAGAIVWDDVPEMERRMFRRAALSVLTGKPDPNEEVRGIANPYFAALVQGIDCALDSAEAPEPS